MHDDPLYDDDLFDHADGADGAAATDEPVTRSFASTRADQWVDELMPDGFDWRHVVETYPRASLAAAALGGLVIGRAHGAGLLTGLSGYFVGEVTRNLKDIVEDITSG
ncbi:MAG: hypothetical protein AAGM22_03875 [Acidobacteriota bacterium]